MPTNFSAVIGITSRARAVNSVNKFLGTYRSSGNPTPRRIAGIGREARKFNP